MKSTYFCIKMAAEENMTYRIMQEIINEDLGLAFAAEVKFKFCLLDKQ